MPYYQIDYGNAELKKPDIQYHGNVDTKGTSGLDKFHFQQMKNIVPQEKNNQSKTAQLLIQPNILTLNKSFSSLSTKLPILHKDGGREKEEERKDVVEK